MDLSGDSFSIEGPGETTTGGEGQLNERFNSRDFSLQQTIKVQ